MDLCFVCKKIPAKKIEKDGKIFCSALCLCIYLKERRENSPKWKEGDVFLAKNTLPKTQNTQRDPSSDL